MDALKNTEIDQINEEEVEAQVNQERKCAICGNIMKKKRSYYCANKCKQPKNI